jgi:ATP-dependent RNA helicase DDX3X
MSVWEDNKDMGDALKDITNSTDSTDGANGANDANGANESNGVDKPTASAPIKNEEAHNLAREKGWVAPEEYDYKSYTAAPGASTEVVQTAEGYTSTAGGDWAHAAVKYEWDESFGDVGPENQLLEEQLFRADSITRQGIKFDR